MSEELEQLEKSRSNRRHFVRNLGLISAAAGVASVVDPSLANAQSGPSDFDILNFALNLEYLEAEFYTVATTGQTITSLGVGVSGTGSSGQTTGGNQVAFDTMDPTVRRYAEELAMDERTHVSLLRNSISALGGSPIAKPAINLGALGFGFGSPAEFLRLSRIFEEIGVTAYGGAASLLTNKTVIDYAARILATEAEHTGAIRSLLARYNINSTPPLDGLDLLAPPDSSQFFSTDENAITFTRTPGQVLFLAYGGMGSASAGGFFPSGVNGPLNTASASIAVNNGVLFYANSNPVPLNGAQYGTTNVIWRAPAPTEFIQIHVGSPTGPLFTTNRPSGQMMTGAWVVDGQMLYLQDISNGKPLTAANTLATLLLRTSA